MHLNLVADRYSDWRIIARALLAAEVPPHQVIWHDAAAPTSLFAPTSDPLPAPIQPPKTAVVPKAFLKLAEWVSCHRSQRRWPLLYRALWRLLHGEPHLLELATDDDVRELHLLDRAVHRDAHKAKAFVRFRQVLTDSGEQFIAWHQPDHRILPQVAPFFRDRFSTMVWAILTPDDTAMWDGTTLTLGPGVPSSLAPPPDELEDLWRDYYAATFNPARIKLQMMKREMPVRYWKNLPETSIIPALLEDAPARVARMIQYQEGVRTSAREYLPAERSLESLASAAAGCQACPLHEQTTQTVFGVGPAHARLVLVGEQPGDEEDLHGQPFIGPAGQVLSTALEQAGLDRTQIYITNAVKHFKFQLVGTHRSHRRPGTREMSACRPWLEAELKQLQPAALICLGATAAQSLLGRDFQLMKRRGEPYHTDWAPWTMATYHPSALLRQQDPQIKARLQRELIGDLALAATYLQTLPSQST